MGLKNARNLSSAKSAVVKLQKMLPGLISNVPVKDLNDFANELNSAGKSVIHAEVTNMTTNEIIRNASSIAYYVKKFGIKS